MTPLLFCLAFAPGADPVVENPLYRELRESGITVAGKSVAKLPTPNMADGLDAAAQKKVIETLPGLRVPVSELTRNATAAPFVLAIGDITPVGDGLRLRTLDLWFIAHGDIDAVAAKKDAGGFTPGQKTDAKTLTADQLRARGIAIPAAEEADTYFNLVSFDLLERVRLTGIVYTRATRSKQSVVVATRIDPRFQNDKEFPSRWQPLDIVAGGLQAGDAKPYAALVSVLKATPLQEPAGAIFVEYHAVFEQPEGWFGGNDLLRSKLPIAVQSGVRSFREDLKKASLPKP